MSEPIDSENIIANHTLQKAVLNLWHLLGFKDLIHRYQAGLARIDEAHNKIAEYKKQVADLLPKKRQAQLEALKLKHSCDKKRKQYIEVRTIPVSGESRRLVSCLRILCITPGSGSLQGGWGSHREDDGPDRRLAEGSSDGVR